jgi:5-hydroxyisourate hydrolase-like protein (transthyretin family)
MILALVVGCAVYAPSQIPSGGKGTNASVSGKVTIKGKPAAGVVVGMRLTQPGPSSPTYKATTNEDGTYRINNIAYGTYQVMPVAPALVPFDRNRERRQTLTITDGDNVENIDFDLVRGGVITGRVTDADGRALVEMSVSLRFVAQPNQYGMYDDLHGQTDDRGKYRIFGIRAGRYKVAVDDPRRFSRGAPSLPVTYFPDVQDSDKAATVDVVEAGEAANIDIKVGPPPPLFSISGRVIDESGQPLPKVSIRLARIITYDANRTSSESGDNGAVSDQRGRFRLANLQAGKYELSTYGEQGSDLQWQAPVKIDVINSDVTDLVVKMARGALVSGTVVFEGTKPAAEMMQRLSVMVYANSETGGFSWAQGGSVRPDGSFVIGGLRSGSISFQVGSGARNGGFTPLRVERDGVVQPNAIQIQGTDHITGLRLFVTHSSGSISGVVKITNGPLPAGAQLSVELSRPGEKNFGDGRVEVDARGHFLVDGLAAGSYELLVSAYVPNQRRPLMVRQQVTVNDGAVTDVTVTLDLTP